MKTLKTPLGTFKPIIKSVWLNSNEQQLDTIGVRKIIATDPNKCETLTDVVGRFMECANDLKINKCVFLLQSNNITINDKEYKDVKVILTTDINDVMNVDVECTNRNDSNNDSNNIPKDVMKKILDEANDIILQWYNNNYSKLLDKTKESLVTAVRGELFYLSDLAYESFETLEKIDSSGPDIFDIITEISGRKPIKTSVGTVHFTVPFTNSAWIETGTPNGYLYISNVVNIDKDDEHFDPYENGIVNYMVFPNDLDLNTVKDECISDYTMGLSEEETVKMVSELSEILGKDLDYSVF